MKVPVLLALLATAIPTGSSFALDKLSIISPHRKSIQREFIPLFKKHYEEKYKTPVEVDWIDQGGSESDVRYIRAKFKDDPKSAKIDVFWGGGDISYYDLEEEGLLAPFDPEPAIKSQIPEEALGMRFFSKKKGWHASALSSFGILYNKRLLTQLKLPEPKKWEDLATAPYLGQISLADPRFSSTSLIMNIIALEVFGWQKGWDVLFATAGNAKHFQHSSSDPIKLVVSGDVSVAPAVDFYAQAKVASIGSQNLGFVLPEGQTIFNADPVAILKGAPNATVAQRFINFLLTPETQRILFLPKGVPGGPAHDGLFRLAANPVAYNNLPAGLSIPNPFAQKSAALTLDSVKIAEVKQVIGDMIGVIMVDQHRLLVQAWTKALKNPALRAMITEPPVTKESLRDLAKNWNDQTFRNTKLNLWQKALKERYEKVLASQS